MRSILIFIAVLGLVTGQIIEWQLQLDDRFVDYLLWTEKYLYASGRDHLFEIRREDGTIQQVYDHVQGQVVNMKAFTEKRTTHYILSLFQNKNLVQFDPQIDENRWSQGSLVTEPVFERDYGIIYVLTNSTTLKALNSMVGTPIWSVQCDLKRETANLHLSADEQTVYVITEGGKVYGYSASSGVTENLLSLPRTVQQTFLVGEYLYGWKDNTLMVFDLIDGHEVNSYGGLPGKTVVSATSVGKNALIETTTALILLADGQIHWIYPTQKDHYTVSSFGDIFLVEHTGPSESVLIKIDGLSGQKEWSFPVNGHCIHATVGENEVYFVTMDKDSAHTARLHLPRHLLEGSTEISSFTLFKVSWEKADLAIE